MKDWDFGELRQKTPQQAIKETYGMVLITGPTGSGKSTTLYALLKVLNDEERNIITLEDPIEYYIEGLNQCQIKPEIGYTFATGLRSILRQDPNVIMVGEIRDNETAELAVHAALTGHLMFSTLHTNTAVGSIPRLIDMGIEPFLLSSSLRLVMAQRLVRKICESCKELVGRPNVGKSTLVNALVGEERVIAFDQPGTSRDSIYVEFERDGKPYILIDTAGVRRKGKVFETVEKFSVIKTLQAIEDANVVVLVLDARENISEQDAHLAGFVVETGRALVVAVNKWDGLSAEQRDDIKREIGRKLAFLDFARFNYISALKSKGLEILLKDVEAAHAAAFLKMSTPKLTRVLEMAVEQHAPPKNGLFRPKPRYAHQGGKNPPVIILHGNALEGLRDA